MSNIRRRWRNWKPKTKPSQQDGSRHADGDGGGNRIPVIKGTGKSIPSPSSFDSKTFKVKKSYTPSFKGTLRTISNANKFNTKINNLIKHM